MRPLGRRGVFGIVATMLALSLVSCKKSSSSSSGAAAAPTSYAGAWTLTATVTAHVGTCGSGGSIPFTAAADGSYNITSGITTMTGGINTTSGAFTATISDTQCGNGSMSGTCSSFSACSGTFSQSGGSGGNAETGNIAFTR